MPRSRKSQRAKRRKEPMLDMRNTRGIMDLTPYNGVCLLRDELWKVKI